MFISRISLLANVVTLSCVICVKTATGNSKSTVVYPYSSLYSCAAACEMTTLCSSYSFQRTTLECHVHIVQNSDANSDTENSITKSDNAGRDKRLNNGVSGEHSNQDGGRASFNQAVTADSSFPHVLRRKRCMAGPCCSAGCAGNATCIVARNNQAVCVDQHSPLGSRPRTGESPTHETYNREQTSRGRTRTKKNSQAEAPTTKRLHDQVYTTTSSDSRTQSAPSGQVSDSIHQGGNSAAPSKLKEDVRFGSTTVTTNPHSDVMPDVGASTCRRASSILTPMRGRGGRRGRGRGGGGFERGCQQLRYFMDDMSSYCGLPLVRLLENCDIMVRSVKKRMTMCSMEKDCLP